jgi:hypothetical protein
MIALMVSIYHPPPNDCGLRISNCGLKNLLARQK